MPLSQRGRIALDPTASPVVASAVLTSAYVLALFAGRALLVPPVQIAATWPSVGVGFVWLLPFLQRPGGWRRWDCGAVLLTMGVLTSLVNLLTGLSLPLAP